MKSSLCVFFFLLFVFVSFVQGQTITHTVSPPAGYQYCDASAITSLFNQINTFRTQHGVRALTMSNVGMQDADIRAGQFGQYMETHPINSPGFNPHTGYDTVAASLGYLIVSENLAYITSDPVYIVNTVWQDSLHLAAMLASEATVMGVSCVISGAGGIYWTYEPGAGTTTPINPPPPTPPPTTGNPPALDSEEAAFLVVINNFRAQNGLGALQVSAALRSSSLWMSTDMAAKNYFSHTDSLGRDPGSRMAAFNYPYFPWGENIAAGFSDGQNTFNQWLNACDPDVTGACTFAHRKNMLGPFTVIGIGRAAGGGFGWVWTTDFGGVTDTLLGGGGTPAPTISSFSATSTSITAGQSTSLVWSVSNSTSLSIDNGVGTVTGLSSKSVSPTQTTTYTLTATNSGGSSTARVTVNVTNSGGGDTQPPSAPSILSSSAKSATEIDISWSASSDNVGVTGYQILRNGAVLKTTSGSTLTLADTTVIGGATYSYTVKAFDAAGNLSASSNTAQITTPAPSPAPSSCAPATNAFTGCYYNNYTLSGSPGLIRTDNQINFNWGGSSPGGAVFPRAFSVRWQGNFTFTQGAYTFTEITSDGMRLYIDNVLVLDRWHDQAPTMYSLQQTLSAGTHLVTVEYYEFSGNATANLTWTQTGGGTPPPPAAPTISSFTANPTSTTAGNPVTLAWSVSGATSASIDNGVGTVTGTSTTVTPSQTTTYTLTASNSGGTSTAKVTVTVTAAPPPVQAPVISSFTASPTSVIAGNPSMLAWSVTGATSTSIDNGVGAVTGTSRTVTPSQTTTYTLTASNSGGTSTAKVTVTVTPPAPPPVQAPVISSFTANPVSVSAGNPTTLAWSVSGATSLSIDNGVGAVTGSATIVSPTQTTTYTLTAANSGGSSTARVTVTVTTPPPTGDTQPPTAPMLSVVGVSTTLVNLSWLGGSDNVGVAGYQVLRNGGVIANVSGASHIYTDASVTQGTSYSYTVKAFDAAGNISTPSNAVSITTPGIPSGSPSCSTPGVNAFTGCYYGNPFLSGAPVMVRTDNQINFSWGNGSPAPPLQPGNFSVRWVGSFTFAQGAYTFTATTSDGMRIYIDGNLVFNSWHDQAARQYQFQQALTAGAHVITVEYYEYSNGSVAMLSWKAN